MVFPELVLVVSSVGCVMRHSLKTLNSRRLLRLAAAGMTAALLAGCSSDASRFNTAFSNPFASSADPVQTGSIAEAPQAGQRAAAITRPLASVTSRPLAPPLSAAAQYAAPARLSLKTAYNVPPVSAPDMASSMARPAAASGTSGWSVEGGTPVVVAQGESAAILARRYGVPENEMLRLNGYGSAAQVVPGSRMVVPVFNGAGRAAQAAPVRQPQIAQIKPVPAKPVRLAKVEAPETAVKQKMTTRKVAAKAAELKKIVVAKAQPPKAAKPLPVKVALAPKPVPDAKPVAPKIMASIPAKPAPLKVAKIEKPVALEVKKPEVDKTPVASLPPPIAPVAPADAANPEFRWPARGRVIQGFKAGGNDGINIAVPEGTSVKAAEGGVVAYAGSELKGYGNLVLIRHPNGFVSAYANNGDIEVKRGETVKRGQTIAKSGQSGNVSSPQLHFELRKGSTPVDPTNYLAGL